MKDKDVYRKAIEYWGEKTQMLMAMSEAGELIAVLGQVAIQGREKTNQVIDEIADMQIMLDQLLLIFDESSVKERKKFKLKRLEKILSGDVKHPHKSRLADKELGK